MAEEQTKIAEERIDIEARFAEPRLVAMLFCDHANVTKENKYNLIGTFDRVSVRPSADDTPNTPPFFLYLRVRATVDSLTLRVYQPDGSLVATALLAAVERVGSARETHFMQMAQRLQFEVPVPGDYWLEVIYRGQPLGGATMTVEYLEGKDETAEEGENQ